MPHNYSNRGKGWSGRTYDDEEDEEDDNGIKPYTAVGAALDSAERFKRRMNYGRKPTKTYGNKSKYILCRKQFLFLERRP